MWIMSIQLNFALPLDQVSRQSLVDKAPASVHNGRDFHGVFLWSEGLLHNPTCVDEWCTGLLVDVHRVLVVWVECFVHWVHDAQLPVGCNDEGLNRCVRSQPEKQSQWCQNLVDNQLSGLRVIFVTLTVFTLPIALLHYLSVTKLHFMSSLAFEDRTTCCHNRTSLEYIYMASKESKRFELHFELASWGFCTKVPVTENCQYDECCLIGCWISFWSLKIDSVHLTSGWWLGARQSRCSGHGLLQAPMPSSWWSPSQQGGIRGTWACLRTPQMEQRAQCRRVSRCLPWWGRRASRKHKLGWFSARWCAGCSPWTGRSSPPRTTSSVPGPANHIATSPLSISSSNYNTTG